MSEIKITPRPLGGTMPGMGPIKSTPDTKENFGDFLSKALKDVDNLQMDATEAQDKLIRGDAADLHQVMIAVEKAGISLDLLLEIRKRLVEAYQEIIRMPV
jgi:flagellar hook-basal body complex protein FliE